MSFTAGTFALIAGNPVVTGTTISSTWANNTLNDIASGLTTCVLKDGTQAITAGIPFFAGSSALPGIYFSTDTSSGLYRPSANVVGISISGTQRGNWSSTGLNNAAIGVGTSAAAVFTSVSAAVAVFATVSASVAVLTQLTVLGTTTSSFGGAIVVLGTATSTISGALIVSGTATSRMGGPFYWGSGSDSYGLISKRKTAEQTVFSTVALTADNALFFPIGVSEEWTADFAIDITATDLSNSGIRLAIAAPTGATINCNAAMLNAGQPSRRVATSSVAIDWVPSQFGVGMTVAKAQIGLWVSNGANTGNVALQFAQSSSTVSGILFNTGSFLNATRIA